LFRFEAYCLSKMRAAQVEEELMQALMRWEELAP
jgi:hypothetical protein